MSEYHILQLTKDKHSYPQNKKIMAEKIIKFLYDNKEIEVAVEATIKREELYGKQSKVVEKDGTPLEKGILTPTGQLFPASAFGTVRVDEKGALIDSPVPQTEDGKQAPTYISSFKESRPLKKITPGDVVDLSVESVIPVKQQVLDEGYYGTEYTYRDSTKLQDAVLVVKGEGDKKESYLLIGDRKETPMLGKLETYNFFEDDEDEAEEEEVDFNMF